MTAPHFATNHFLSSFRQAPPNLGSPLLSNELAPAATKGLEVLGHKVKVPKSLAVAPVMLRIDPKSGQKEAAGDPRT